LKDRTDFYGYGWKVAADGTYGHSGSDGTYTWIDAERDLFGVIFAQSTGGNNPRNEFVKTVRRGAQEPPGPSTRGVSGGHDCVTALAVRGGPGRGRRRILRRGQAGAVTRLRRRAGDGRLAGVRHRAGGAAAVRLPILAGDRRRRISGELGDARTARRGPRH